MGAHSSTARSAAPRAGRASRERNVTCPAWEASAPWQTNTHRPFCSLTCRLVDLGVWLDEGYRIPADERGNVP
jgi:endogenous inhibitor of DNA gyrase (YacG/DUF329 family)